MKDKVVRKYLRKVRHIYRAKRDIKKKLMIELEDTLLCYTEKHPDCTYQQLLQEFGSPSDIRQSLSLLPDEKLSRRSLVLFWGLIVAVSVLAVFMLYKTINYVYGSYYSSNGYFIIESFTEDPEHPRPASTPEPGSVRIYFDDEGGILREEHY